MNSPATSASPYRVAIIGAGTMGTAMATRLVAEGMRVAVWSRHRASTEAATASGATQHDEAATAVADADVVITMLPTAAAIREVMFDAGTLLAMRAHATWAQMSTIGVAATRRLAIDTERLRGDVAFVDAPVSGSRGPAASGELLVLASGPSNNAGALGAVFRALANKTMWLGSVGAGSAMKLVLNTWLAFQTEGAAESAALAETLGVAPSLLRKALSDSPLASRYALAKLDRMQAGAYDPDFALDWALKDLDLVDSDGDPDATPIASEIASRWRDLIATGSSGLDVSAARHGLGPSIDAPTSRTQRRSAE